MRLQIVKYIHCQYFPIGLHSLKGRIYYVFRTLDLLNSIHKMFIAFIHNKMLEPITILLIKSYVYHFVFKNNQLYV